jgi:endonuclease YncB( thermonuclease family)
MPFRTFTFARFLFAAACLCAPPAFADNLTGQASIIDGDTLEIHGTRIRLWGIDAPESNQLCRGDDSTQYRCGAKAANDLDSFLAKRPIDCAPVNLDQYRRTVAVCQLTALTLPSGWCATASRSIGPNTPKESTIRRNVMLSMRGGVYGKAATKRR